MPNQQINPTGISRLWFLFGAIAPAGYFIR
jgi:hypothetical protein